jgi:hypothetical protein
MFRDDFIQASGGVFHSRKGWDRLSSSQKYREFWAFFDLPGGETTSVYAGVQVQQLLKSGDHSVEHVVPRALLDFELSQQPLFLRRGASINPLNFAASHRRTNTHRGHAIFDFESDAITQRSRLDVHTLSTEKTGLDHEGEWVVPPRTRGDIARAVIYMFMVYPLPRLRSENAEALLEWHVRDQPSPWEQRYNKWVWDRKGIHNPLVNSPDCPSFPIASPLLYDALTKTK